MSGLKDRDIAPAHPLAMGLKGLHHSSISLANQRAVLMLVATTPGISNAEIARRTGLGAQTVSRFLADLEEAGMIRRGRATKGQPGLPATPYELVHDRAMSFGVSIGCRRTDVVLMNMSGVAQRQETIGHDRVDPERLCDDVRAACERLAGSLDAALHERIIGIGVAVPYDLAGHLGRMGADHALCARWDTFDVVAGLAAATGRTVWLYDSGQAAAWAEHAGPGSPWSGEFAYVHVDDVVTSGIVLRGALLNAGRAGLGGRLALTLVAGSGNAPRTLDDVVSLARFERRHGAAADRAERFDGADGRAWMQDATEALAQALANAAMLAGTRYGVIGGDLPAQVLDELCEAVSGRLRSIWPGASDPAVVGAGLAGAFAPAIGAAYLPIYEQFFQRSQPA